MTAASFAELVNAKRIGPNRWQARCPSHSDKHPSLSIRQGERGTLLRCWAGCRTEDVLAALGLPMSALFDDAGLTPQQRAAAVQQRQAHDAERKAQHHAECERNRELYRLECLRDALGGRLARNPDDAEIARLFHAVENKLHTLESGLPHHEDGPLGLKPSPEMPAWIADELRKIFTPDSPPIILPNGSITFIELSEWTALQNLKTQKETARSQRAA